LGRFSGHPIAAAGHRGVAERRPASGSRGAGAAWVQCLAESAGRL